MAVEECSQSVPQIEHNCYILVVRMESMKIRIVRSHWTRQR